LIRTINQGEEYQHLLESFENQPEGFSPKWDIKDTGKIWSTVFQNQMQKMRHKNEEE
jgi:flagellar protein FliO/FliZ